MIVSNKELNRYKKLKTKIAIFRADIQFLKRCKKNKCFPRFIQERIRSKCRDWKATKVIHEARRKMLNLEIKSKYAHSDAIKMELYSLHLFLVSNVHPVVWQSIEMEILRLVTSKLEFPSVTITDRLPTDIGNFKLPTITDGKSVKRPTQTFQFLN
jgi:hypothetical protein